MCYNLKNVTGSIDCCRYMSTLPLKLASKFSRNLPRSASVDCSLVFLLLRLSCSELFGNKYDPKEIGL